MTDEDVIAAHCANLFKMNYITRDLDAAMAHCKAELGIEHFDTTDAEVDVLSCGKLRPLKIRAAFGNDARQAPAAEGNAELAPITSATLPASLFAMGRPSIPVCIPVGARAFAGQPFAEHVFNLPAAHT